MNDVTWKHHLNKVTAKTLYYAKVVLLYLIERNSSCIIFVLFTVYCQDIFDVLKQKSKMLYIMHFLNYFVLDDSLLSSVAFPSKRIFAILYNTIQFCLFSSLYFLTIVFIKTSIVHRLSIQDTLAHVRLAILFQFKGFEH